jgi:Uma2 family endonuclease
VAANVTARLWQHARARRLGRVFTSSQGFVIARGPDRVLAPDGAFVSFARLPHVPTLTFVEGAPDLVLEVRSPGQTWSAIAGKCGVWLSHGVLVAWGIDPIERVVAEFRPLLPAVERREGSVSAEPAMAGFSIALEDVFEGI